MRAFLDTSVLVAGDYNMGAGFELAVTSPSYAELEFGAHMPGLDPVTRALRRERIIEILETFGPGAPFDDRAAQSYGLLTECVMRSGRQVRRRVMGLQIAAIAHCHHVALVTLNAEDLRGIERLVKIIPGAAADHE